MTRQARKSRKLKAPAAEAIYNVAPKLHATFEVGDVAHQGDLIIVRITALPSSAVPRADRQLAEGSTQGSRHVLVRGDVFNADTSQVQDAIRSATGVLIDSKYVGPVFVSPESPTANDLAHPEHGDQGFPAGSVCAVVYQRNLDAEDREARVQD
jgi:hypothetical protein